MLGSVSALIFFFLRDLLDVSLSLETLNDMTAPIAIIAAAATFLPYYWAVYRQDQEALPEAEIEPPPAARQSIHKPVTLLATDGSELATRLQDALGYQVSQLQWADANSAQPTLTEEECAEIARLIADAPGSYILLIPDGDSLRILSHD